MPGFPPPATRPSHETGPRGPYRRVGGVSGHLNPGGQQFRGDRGGADPRVTAALAAYQAGQGSEQAALDALAAARLLVPVMAVLGSEPSEQQEPVNAKQADKNSEMALPTLIGRDGRPAVLAFTGTEALARWRPDARPAPAEADRVWRAAVADGCAVVIDVAGPVPLAVEGARLAALAAGQPVPPPHQDPDVRAQVEAALTEAAQAQAQAQAQIHAAPANANANAEAAPANASANAEAAPANADAAPTPAVTGFRLDQAQTDGIDLTIRLHMPGPANHAAANRAAAAIAARLGGRLRRGIEIVIAE